MAKGRIILNEWQNAEFEKPFRILGLLTGWT